MYKNKTNSVSPYKSLPDLLVAFLPIAGIQQFLTIKCSWFKCDMFYLQYPSHQKLLSEITASLSCTVNFSISQINLYIMQWCSGFLLKNKQKILNVEVLPTLLEYYGSAILPLI